MRGGPVVLVSAEALCGGAGLLRQGLIQIALKFLIVTVRQTNCSEIDVLMPWLLATLVMFCTLFALFSPNRNY